MALVDRALRAASLARKRTRRRRTRSSSSVIADNVQATGFRRAPEAAALRGFPGGARAGAVAARRGCERRRANETRRLPNEAAESTAIRDGYNFAYLDEQTKRMIRRAILKAIAIPGYQVPFASREMPMPYGWGTGGVQVTASIIGPDDILKVIDQGADDTTNAVSIRAFLREDSRRRNDNAHRARPRSSRPAIASPKRSSPTDQIIVFQVPIPEPLRFLEPRETETRQHARARGLRADAREALRGHRPPRSYRHHLRLPGQGRRPLHDGSIADAEVRQSRRWTCAPALQLFGAGREKRIYAVPPHTRVRSLDFDDHPFERTEHSPSPAGSAAPTGVYPRRDHPRRPGRPACSSAQIPTIARRRARGTGQSR